MTFLEAVRRTPAIRGALKPGLQPLKRPDRRRVSCDSRRLLGSVDIDGSLHSLLPNETRWDYAIGLIREGDSVFWIEVHPASSLHIDEVLKKLHWLHRWLETSAPELRRLPRRFLWIATGMVSFRRGSPQQKRIAAAGLSFPVKHVDLDQVQLLAD